MKEKYHFIGIGGIGMSGLARILLAKKAKVSGSDLKHNFITEALVKDGAEVHIGHSVKYVTKTDVVVYSTDIKNDNPEYQTALALNCKMFHRSELLAELMKEKKMLAVSGTHGKTTTSSLLASVLTAASLDPTYAVGGVVPSLGGNSGVGEGPYAVVEADESDGSFLKYNPFGAIVTNIDLDHLNYFKNEDNLCKAFERFCHKIASQKHLFWCGDDPRLQSLMLPGVSYGFGPACALQVLSYKQKGWSSFMDIAYKGIVYSQIEVPLIGKHQVLNASAVFGLCLDLGIEEALIRSGIKSFKGVLRRSEIKGEVQNIQFIDDYAHHPTEIKATLEGVRSAVGGRRLIAVFQPHRYTRTLDSAGLYKGVFDEADEVVITDIYAAGETEIPGVTSEMILEEAAKDCRFEGCCIPREELVPFLARLVRPHDVVVTLGAGDITRVGGNLLNVLQKKGASKLRVGVVFGGASLEHEISLMSASHIIQSLDRELYEPVLFGITKEGFWIEGEDSLERLKKNKALSKSSAMGKVIEKLVFCDLLFPVLHGPFGEDGTIQGLFEMLGKPYVGCDFRSAAVAMDKALTKKLVLAQGIATSPFVSFSRASWKSGQNGLMEEIKEKLKYPVFVKPVHLGSAIGVKKVEKEEMLKEAIEKAFLVDTVVIVENEIKGREIEFAVFGNEEVKVFPPGEICSNGDMYDYDAKYGENCMGTQSVASLSTQKIEEGICLARMAYQAVGCSGYARVDFFLDREERFWLNEINPIPGFTQISLYPKICEAHGLKSRKLLDELITLSLERHRAQKKTAKATLSSVK